MALAPWKRERNHSRCCASDSGSSPSPAPSFSARGRIGSDGARRVVVVLRCLGEAGVDGRGQIGQARAREQFCQRQVDREGPADPAQQPHRDQRMAAEFEEVVAAADPGQPEQFLPQLRQRGFAGAARRFERGVGERGRVRRRQSARVELAVGRDRQRGHGDEGRRQHGRAGARPGSAARRPSRGRGRRRRGGCRRRRAPHRPPARPGRRTFAREHRALAHLRVFGQTRLDFARLDAEAADLDLLVVAAEEFQPPVGAEAGEVAGAVHARDRAGRRIGERFGERVGEWVGEKTLGFEFAPVQVAARHAGAGQVQLAGGAARHRLAVAVEQVDAAARDRPSDRRMVGFGVEVGTQRASDRDVGFGRAVMIVQPAIRQLPQQPAQLRGQAQLLAGDDDLAQVRAQRVQRRVAAVLDGFGQSLRGDVGQVQAVDALRAQQRRQRGEVQALVGVEQHQRGAAAQRAEDLLERHVEAERGELQHASRRRQRAALPVQQLRQRRVRHRHALGRAGRAGGVDHVGEVLRVGFGLRREFGRFPVVAVERVRQCRVEVQRRRRVRRRRVRRRRGQRCASRGVGQHRHRRGVGEHLGQAFARMIEVQRHISGAGLERGQRADHDAETASRAQPDALVGTGAERAQPPRQAFGARVEFGVVHASPGMDQRGRLRGRAGLAFEQAMHAFGRPGLRLGFAAAELFEQVHAFVRTDQVDARDRLPRPRAERVQRRTQIAQLALDGGRIEQFAGIAEFADQFAVLLAQVQFQLEAHRRERLARAHVQAGQVETSGLVALPGQQRLEQRRAVDPALGLGDFDHLLERQVLVGLGAERGGAHALQQLGDVGLAADIDAQRQGVDEETQQRFDLGAFAIGRGRADDYFVLPGQPRQHQRPGRGHGHEQAAAVGAAQRLQAREAFGVDAQRRAAGGLRRPRRTGRSVGSASSAGAPASASRQ
nr:hypothetical protein [Lysobacter enzymogenes]